MELTVFSWKLWSSNVTKQKLKLKLLHASLNLIFSFFWFIKFFTDLHLKRAGPVLLWFGSCRSSPLAVPPSVDVFSTDVFSTARLMEDSTICSLQKEQRNLKRCLATGREGRGRWGSVAVSAAEGGRDGLTFLL